VPRHRLTHNLSTSNCAQRLGEPWIDQRTSNNIRFTFSGKERDEETGYNYFGARYYNSDVSIWLSVDPLSDKYPNVTGYNYCFNNPLILIDPNGMEPIDYFDTNGNKIGHDGNPEDKRNFIITNKDDVNTIRNNDKAGGTTRLSDVSSAKEIPSKASLQSALNDLKTTISVGGDRERASITNLDGTWVSNLGPVGIQNDKVVEGEATLPNLSDGCTWDDVAAISHSHLTKTYYYMGIPFVGGDARNQSDDDKTGAFMKTSFNIISGPLGQGTYPVHVPGWTPPNQGMVIYKNGTNSFEITTRSAANLIKNME
jgi:RHS repeat-associated protein